MGSILLSLIAVIALIAIIIGFVALSIYNGLVKKRNYYRNAFSQIDVQLKRRHDLIPNLVETAKKYMQHEKDTLTEVIEARNKAISANNNVSQENAKSMQDLAIAEQGLNGAMGKFFALQESYPDLRSNQNMMQLNEELTSTENKVSFARQAYNDSVTSYNNARETFPSSFFASTFNFRPAMLFELDSKDERKSIDVKF